MALLAPRMAPGEIGTSCSSSCRAPTGSDELDPGESQESRPMGALLARAERQWDLAEHDLSLAKAVLEKPALKSGQTPTLQARLLALHLQESQKEPLSSHLNPCSNLLSQLCRRDPSLRRLILTLENRGYTCHVSAGAAPNAADLELLKLPYEEEDLLGYIDAQEIPPLLLDLLDGLKFNLFYEGCLIVEIRDLRRKSPALLGVGGSGTATRPVVLGGCEVHHVLLRPTTQSIICDSNLLAQQSPKVLSAEERVALEAQVVLQTQTKPLCLDPDPVVSIMAKKADVAQKKLSSLATRRAMKKHSQVGINRKRKLEQCSAPKEVALLDFIQKLSNKRTKGSPSEALQRHQTMAKQKLRSQSSSESAWSSASPDLFPSPPLLDPPQATKVLEFARPMVKRTEVTDMTPHVVEEYILETAERGSQRVYHTRLTIFQRLANDEYLGELYVERDYREHDNKGSTCRFVLGTRPHALRYINQFTEIFTEEGRKSVKITHKVPNQAPRVSCTPGMRERINNERAALNRITAPIPVSQTNSAPATAGPSQAQPVASNGSASSLSSLSSSSGTTAASPNLQVGTPQPAVLQKKIISMPPAASSTAPILQQQLSSPTASIQQQLPLHPLPPTQAVNVNRATSAPVVSARIINNGPPTSVVAQNPLTSPLTPQTPMLPVTPHPMTPMAQPSPAPTTPLSVAPTTPMTPQQPSPAIQNLNPPTPNASTNGPQDMQEQAISAIMQSLMNDSDQFEAEKCKQQHLPSPVSGQLVGGAQLPTRPVPPASLAGVVSNSKPITSTCGSANSKLMANRVTFQNLLSAQVQTPPPATPPSPSSCGNTPSKANSMPQLAAQLSRPVNLPPTYTQAVAQAQIQAHVVQTNSEGEARTLVVQQQGQGHPQILRRQSAGGGVGDLSKTSSLSQDAPGLQALLANAPSADNPNPIANGSHGRSILERLVSGGQTTRTANALSSSIISVSSGSRSLPGTQSGLSAADPNQEITLTAILAKPPSVSTSPHSLAPNSASPTKASPLLHQLRQPVQQNTSSQPILQSNNQAQVQMAQSSPLRPQMSPARQQQQQSQQQVQSPRMIQPSPGKSFSLPPQSPRSQTNNHQTLIMQPPSSQRSATSSNQQSILSATLQQVQASPQQTVNVIQQGGGLPMMSVPVQDLVNSNHVPNGILSNGPSSNSMNAQQQQQQQHTSQSQNVMSLQNLLQSGMVQVSTGGSGSTTQSNMVQLSIPGLSAPVTLSVSLPDSAVGGQIGHGGAQHQGIFVASQSGLQQKQNIATTVGKLLQANSISNSMGGQPTTVVLQSSGHHNNFIQLPQQPAVSVKSAQGGGQQQIQQGSYIKTMSGSQLVQVRHGSQGQVLLQMPSGQAGGVPVSQPIQIVRAMAQPQHVMRTVQQATNQQQQQIVQLSSIKSPPMLPTAPSPQAVGVPPSPVGSITSPQSGVMMPPDSPLALSILPSGGGGGGGTRPPTPGGNEVIMSGPPGLGGHGGGVPKTSGINAQNALKMRQQRKQSLK